MSQIDDIERLAERLEALAGSSETGADATKLLKSEPQGSSFKIFEDDGDAHVLRWEKDNVLQKRSLLAPDLATEDKENLPRRGSQRSQNLRIRPPAQPRGRQSTASGEFEVERFALSEVLELPDYIGETDQRSFGPFDDQTSHSHRPNESDRRNSSVAFEGWFAPSLNPTPPTSPLSTTSDSEL